ncbi:uncharacterized protein WCC33_014310 [Rhinophrynus dorsalis]
MDPIIRIFSRCATESYDWLIHFLNETFKSFVICSFSITNNNGQELRHAVRNCTFAILYHSRKHGRVNITDVVDSLYDDELQHLSDSLGKKRVIVIVDDLNKSSREEKQRILNNQPKIGRLARDVFLFTTEEKRNEKMLREMMIPIIDLITAVVLLNQPLVLQIKPLLALPVPWPPSYWSLEEAAVVPP